MTLGAKGARRRSHGSAVLNEGRPRRHGSVTKASARDGSVARPRVHRRALLKETSKGFAGGGSQN
jgi:hypothetical protein